MGKKIAAILEDYSCVLYKIIVYYRLMWVIKNLTVDFENHVVRICLVT